MTHHHTFDPDAAGKLEDQVRYRYLSRDELVDALEPTPDADVVDLGSGTGFYTRDVAPHVGSIRAVDVQPEMHEHFRSLGVPENVTLVSAGIEDLPFDDSALDAAYATMTFHEFAGEDPLAEVARVLRPGARLVVVDWSSEGETDRGPPLEARYSPGEATAELRAAGFTVDRTRGRPGTFLVTATRP